MSKKITIVGVYLVLFATIGCASTRIPSNQVSVVTSGFSKNLNSSDTNVQAALNTIDQLNTGGGGGSGTVTSVAMTGDNVIYNSSVTGSPITTSGTLSPSLKNQSANTFFAAPNGSSNTPTFRAIVAADVPTLNQNTTGNAATVTNGVYTTGSYANPPWLTNVNYSILNGTVPTWNQNTTGTASNVTGIIAITNGGTGQTTQQNALNALSGTQSSGTYLRSNGTNVSLSTIQAADVPTLNQNTTGTATGISGSQTANTFLAAPNGSSGTATFRTIVAADVPTLNQNTTGNAATVTTNANLTGVITSVGNATSLASQTGTGSQVVVSNGPSLTTPNLGVATATSINKITLTQPATGATLTIANGKTLNINNTFTINSTDGVTETTPSTSFTTARTDAANTFTGHQTIEGVTSTGATGTGNFVFSSSPTLVTPTLGAASATSLNISGLNASIPIFTDGSKNLTSGTISGNTTKVVTTTGTLTTGDCLKIDGFGNIIDAGSACGLSSPGGSNTYVQYNNSGSFGGSSNFIFNGTQVGIQQATPSYALDVGNTARVVNLLDSGLAFNKPIYSNGTATLVSGTFSGNTTIFGTVNGSLTSNDCIKADSNGNLVDSGSACGSGGSSQWTTSGSNIYYNSGNVGIGLTSGITSPLTVAGNIATTGTAAGAFEFIEPSSAGSNYVALQAPASISSSLTFTLPAADGTNGQCLETNGSKVLSFGACSGGGGSGTVSSGTIGKEAVYTGSTTVGSGIITDNGSAVGINYSSPTWNLTVGGASGTDFRVVDTLGASNGALFQALNDPGSGLVAGNRLGGFSMNGVYDSSHDIVSHTPAAVYGWANETWSNSTNGSYVTIEATPNGSTSRNTIATFMGSGNVGIGVTNPQGALSVAGHIHSKGASLSVTSCGTSPSLSSYSSDNWGRVTVGTGASTTSCTINFANTWSQTPFCVVMDNTNIVALKGSSSATALTVTSSTTMSSVSVGDILTWVCGGGE